MLGKFQMNNLPLVSVLIPAYNHEAYIEESIESIIWQTYANIELLVVDDGSTDGTWKKICNIKTKCERRFSRVVFESQKNQGTCVTLNKLISLAHGEFIYLIASDDVAKSDAIDREVEFLRKNSDYVLVVGDNELIDDSSQCVCWDARHMTFGDFLKDERKDISFASDRFGTYETLLRRNYIPNGYLMRSSAVRRIEPFTPEAPLEDLYLHLQLSKLGKYKYLDEVLFSYRIHEGNTAKCHAHMKEISVQTYRYEREIVGRAGMEKWKDLFESNIMQVRRKINIGHMVKYYMVKSFEQKVRILEVCGKRFYGELQEKRPLRFSKKSF